MKSKKKNLSVLPAKKKTSKAKLSKSSRKALSGKVDSSDLMKDIWPNERDVVFRPDRLKYVRKMVKPEGCVFCNAAQRGISKESLVLFLGDHAMVLMNKFPYNPGHLLVLPRRHVGGFLDLTEQESAEIHLLLRKCLNALHSTSQPGGFNIGLNLGSAAGAGIPDHLHYHLVPRWHGDTNFFPLLADTKVVVETIEQTYERLVPWFS